ncbi:Hypothetical predicted protein [Octopus vulgaris]|uniref:Uncharacterized protein n=1 Tax=Octopus vulgaris TaxID=6645 RepID=A0AA36ANE2_OCTVU|nr:Hypothetical predicted protein [Octopus vulgaris]
MKGNKKKETKKPRKLSKNKEVEQHNDKTENAKKAQADTFAMCNAERSKINLRRFSPITVTDIWLVDVIH